MSYLSSRASAEEKVGGKIPHAELNKGTNQRLPSARRHELTSTWLPPCFAAAVEMAPTVLLRAARSTNSHGLATSSVLDGINLIEQRTPACYPKDGGYKYVEESRPMPRRPFVAGPRALCALALSGRRKREKHGGWTQKQWLSLSPGHGVLLLPRAASELQLGHGRVCAIIRQAPTRRGGTVLPERSRDGERAVRPMPPSCRRRAHSSSPRKTV